MGGLSGDGRKVGGRTEGEWEWEGEREREKNFFFYKVSI